MTQDQSASPERKDINAQAIVEAVQIANELRSMRPHLFGRREEPIEDLPKGIPGDARECVLARAFNFNCTVDKALGGRWSVAFPSNRKRYAKKLATLLGSTCTELATGQHCVILPSHIGRIAQDFDLGELDGKYYDSRGDTPPIAKLIIKRNHNADLWFERWEWKLWIDPTKETLGNRYPDYEGHATTQKRALKKGMKLVPRYVRIVIR